MNDRERVPMLLVTGVGLVTIGLVFALGFALYPDRPGTALLFGTGVCAPFAAIIAAGLHGARVRSQLEPTASLPATEPGSHPTDRVSVDISDITAEWIASRRRAPWVAGAAALGMAAWLGVGIVWWIGLAMAGVAAVTIGVLVSADRPALRFVEAAGARPLIADAEGLSLPVECLAGGIAQHAVGRAESVVRVPWETITAWEIFEHQHVLQVRPDPARYGIFPRFAIPRRGSILAAEHALLAVARAHLRVPIEVRHGG